MKTVIIEGMACKHCVKRVEGVFKELGIKKAKVDIGSAQYQSDLDNERVKTAIEDAGYTVVSISNVK